MTKEEVRSVKVEVLPFRNFFLLPSNFYLF